ncbi:MAG: GNAT family N-acetyltransferase [Anaerolineaceae bacterium]
MDAEKPIRIVPYDKARHGHGPWRVVGAVFEEYGFPFAESEYDADLLDPGTYYDGVRGWFAVAEDGDGKVVGCIGVTDEGGGLFELHRLYVLAEGRRGGTGRRLVEWVFETARAHGCTRMELFSDVHFEDAHRLYLRHGFRNDRFRYAPDPWGSREWGFTREFPAEDA